jgi:very-short-patch-repair endonuclease
VQKGSLIPKHPGVYRVGHAAPSTEADYMAAVLACGDSALLSGRAAGHLLRLLKGSSPPPEVTTRTERRIRGVTTKRVRGLDLGRDGTTWRGIPVTSVARTLVDLAAVLGVDALARACHEAGVLHGTTPAEVEAVLARHPKAPGAGKLRWVMRGDVRVTLSRLEGRFLTILREAGLPLPVTNKPAGGSRVDWRWTRQQLTVELDSYTYHRSRHAWERDRRREREARARGDDFYRYTYDDVYRRARVVIRELRAFFLGTSPRGVSDDG